MKLAIVFLLVVILFYTSSAKSVSRESKEVSKEHCIKNKLTSLESNESRGYVRVDSDEVEKGKNSDESLEKAPRNKSREKRDVKSKSNSTESNSSESGEKNIPASEAVEKVEATTTIVDEEVTV